MEEIAIRTPEEIGYMREAGRILVGAIVRWRVVSFRE